MDRCRRPLQGCLKGPQSSAQGRVRKFINRRRIVRNGLQERTFVDAHGSVRIEPIPDHRPRLARTPGLWSISGRNRSTAQSAGRRRAAGWWPCCGRPGRTRRDRGCRSGGRLLGLPRPAAARPAGPGAGRGGRPAGRRGAAAARGGGGGAVPQALRAMARLSLYAPIGTLVSYFTRERLKLVRKRLMLCSFARTRRQNRL